MRDYFEKIYKESYLSFIKIVGDNLKNNKKMFIVTANPETFIIASKDETFSKILLADITTIVPDGIGIVKASRMLNYNVVERIPGIEIAWTLLKEGNKARKSIYLLGGTEDVIVLMTKKIHNDYPNLKIVGVCNGYVEDKDAAFKKIIKLQPDIVLVALGIPAQEKLIFNHLGAFEKGIFVGVGGSLDVISGQKKRAPKIFQKFNLEWLYRLLKEPSRIKRFYNSNVKFMFKIKSMIKKNEKR